MLFFQNFYNHWHLAEKVPLFIEINNVESKECLNPVHFRLVIIDAIL